MQAIRVETTGNQPTTMLQRVATVMAMARQVGIRIRIIGTRLASQKATITTLLRTRVKVTAWGTLDADKFIYSKICLATGQGESQEWGSLFGAWF